MRGRLRFLILRRFWLNYVFILAVTSWAPLLTQNATLTGSDGKVLQQATVTVRAWQSWWSLFTKGPGSGHGRAVVMHLGLCFIITAVVWFLMFRPVVQDLPEPGPEPPSDNNAPSPGDATHE
jgi:hypothetical protein